MICNVCGTKEASIHLTEIVNGKMAEVHICEACAEEKGTEFKTYFNFGDLLAGVSGLENALGKSGKVIHRLGLARTEGEVKSRAFLRDQVAHDQIGDFGGVGSALAFVASAQ